MTTLVLHSAKNVLDPQFSKLLIKSYPDMRLDTLFFIKQLLWAPVIRLMPVDIVEVSFDPNLVISTFFDNIAGHDRILSNVKYNTINTRSGDLVSSDRVTIIECMRRSLVVLHSAENVALSSIAPPNIGSTVFRAVNIQFSNRHLYARN